MKKTIVIAIVVAAIVVPAAIYAAGPLFVNTTINEAAPLAPMAAVSTSPGDNMTGKPDMMETRIAGTFVGVGDGIHDAEGAATVIPVA
ncbi:MAG TPA: hypothetical protein VJ742_11800, partial [Nitrososphaera sp.]|nr:hypothetical protein [Nitrososphaera sp.]